MCIFPNTFKWYFSVIFTIAVCVKLHKVHLEGDRLPSCCDTASEFWMEETELGAKKQGANSPEHQWMTEYRIMTLKNEEEGGE